jgi:hypothetical protein
MACPQSRYNRARDLLPTVAMSLKTVARPEGFEPPTLCLEGRRSFQLSYGRDAGTADIVRELWAGWKRGNEVAGA